MFTYPSDNTVDQVDSVVTSTQTKPNPTILTKTTSLKAKTAGVRRSSLPGSDVVRNLQPEKGSRFSIVMDGREAQNSSRLALKNSRAREGMISTTLGPSDSFPILNVKSVHSKMEVLRLSLDHLDVHEYCRKLYSRYSKKFRILTKTPMHILIKISEYAVSKGKRLIILCADHMVASALVSELEIRRIPNTTLDNCIRSKSPNVRKKVVIATVIDFMLQTANSRIDTAADLYLLNDEHRRTAPYQALLYYLANFEYSSNWAFLTLGNEINVAAHPLHVTVDVHLPTMDVRKWSSPEYQRYFMHIATLNTLFIFPNQEECLRARVIMAKQGIRKIDIVFDRSDYAAVELLMTNSHESPVTVLCTGWPERFQRYTFDCIFDCGCTDEVVWNNGFDLKRFPIYLSEANYRQCMAKDYYLYCERYELRRGPDLGNSLVRLDVMSILRFFNITPVTQYEEEIDTILTGLSKNAITGYLSSYLYLPMYTAYIDQSGYAMDNFSAGLSLYMNGKYDLQSSGVALKASDYESWADIKSAKTLVCDYTGYEKVPCVSYIDDITRAMLVINTFKPPHIFTTTKSAEELEKKDTNMFFSKLDREVAKLLPAPPVLKPSLSTPPVMRAEVLHASSPLSPTNVLKNIRSRSTDNEPLAVRRRSEDTHETRHRRKPEIRNISDIVGDERDMSYGHAVEDIEEEDTEESGQYDDDDAVSIYSVDSKMSIKKKKRGSGSARRLKRRVSFKESVEKIREDFSKRSEMPNVERSRVEFSVKRTFGVPAEKKVSKRSVRGVSLASRSPMYLPDGESISDLTFKQYVVPALMEGGHDSFLLQPTSEEIVLIYKFILNLPKAKFSTITLSARSETLFVNAFCTCWNRLVSGDKFRMSDISFVSRALLLSKLRNDKLHDTITLHNLRFVARQPFCEDILVRVCAYKEI